MALELLALRTACNLDASVPVQTGRLHVWRRQTARPDRHGSACEAPCCNRGHRAPCGAHVVASAPCRRRPCRAARVACRRGAVGRQRRQFRRARGCNPVPGPTLACLRLVIRRQAAPACARAPWAVQAGKESRSNGRRTPHSLQSGRCGVAPPCDACHAPFCTWFAVPEIHSSVYFIHSPQPGSHAVPPSRHRWHGFSPCPWRPWARG